MRRLISLVLLFLLLLTASAWALPKDLKVCAEKYTGRVCVSDMCSYTLGEATYLPQHDVWLTTAHLAENDTVTINGHAAELVIVGEADGCCNNWALMRTDGYTPQCRCPMICSCRDLQDIAFGQVWCGQDSFYVNLNKCHTVTKTRALCVTDTNFITTTAMDCGNEGAGVFDHCGRLIGIVSCRLSDPCNPCNGRRTCMVRITDDLLAALDGLAG